MHVFQYARIGVNMIIGGSGFSSLVKNAWTLDGWKEAEICR